MVELNKDVVIIVIKNEDNLFYTHQRSFNKKAFPGLWGLGAGGFVNPSETIVQAAPRELYEELKVRPEIKLLFSFPFEHPTVARYNITTFEALVNGECKACEREFHDSGWKPKEFIDDLFEQRKLCPDTAILWDYYRNNFL